MARTVDTAVHAVRRDAFIDAATRLITSRGYETVSIQDVLDELGASRGAFYHYFDSKASLLEAVVGRMVDTATADVLPGIEAPGLDALARFQAVFGGFAQWKGDRPELMLAVLEAWLDDDNAVVREKFRRSLVPRLAPLLAGIVEQGNRDGTFATGDPDATARVLVSLIQGANETAVQLYCDRQTGAVSFEEVERTLTAYGTAFERVLGIPAGSYPAPDPDVLRRWFGEPATPTEESVA